MTSIRPFVQSGVIWLVIGLAERKTVLHAHGPEIRRPKVCQTQPGKEGSAKAPTEPVKQASGAPAAAPANLEALVKKHCAAPRADSSR